MQIFFNLHDNLSILFSYICTQEENVAAELEVFAVDDGLNRNFERTYGWSWLLKLQEELLRGAAGGAAPASAGWSRALAPLARQMARKYAAFLPSLAYPNRIGTHDNTAFGIIFPLEYEAYGEAISQIRYFFFLRHLSKKKKKTH